MLIQVFAKRSDGAILTLLLLKAVSVAAQTPACQGRGWAPLQGLSLSLSACRTWLSTSTCPSSGAGWCWACPWAGRAGPKGVCGATWGKVFCSQVWKFDHLGKLQLPAGRL